MTDLDPKNTAGVNFHPQKIRPLPHVFRKYKPWELISAYQRDKS